MKVLVPGKTFLVGEYLALIGGPSLIACSKPYFEITFAHSKTLQLGPLHKDSPAGRFLQHKKLKVSVNFNNPYYPPGGLGASTAEFLGAFKAWLATENHPLDLDELLAEYLALFSGNKRKPSGMDLIAQALGDLVVQTPKENYRKSMDWPFKDLALLLVHTNKKLATHHHLSELATLPDLERLKTSANDAIQALEIKDETLFIESIKSYAKELHRLDLVATHTRSLLEKFDATPEILAAKGCGAMGADVIALLLRPNHKEQVINHCSQHGTLCVASMP